MRSSRRAARAGYLARMRGRSARPVRRHVPVFLLVHADRAARTRWPFSRMTRRRPLRKSGDGGEEIGFSYFVFGADFADALAPVVAELAGR